MIYLIGFMGAGKTIIGEQLAKLYNVNFIDTDKEIENLTNKSISDIFKEDGEIQFRKLETETLQTATKGKIVACGGGLPAYNNNMEFIRRAGISIYLKSSEDVIFSRLSRSSKKRPLIQNKSDEDLRVFIAEKINEREKFYLLANHTIDTSNLTDTDVLREINSLCIPI